MPVAVQTTDKLVLKSGSTTLNLSKETQTAVLQLKFLIWKLKPAEAPLNAIRDVRVDTTIDRATGEEVCSTTLVMRSGCVWALPAAHKQDANTDAAAIRSFLA